MIINHGIGVSPQTRGEALLAVEGAVLLGLLTALCHGASVTMLDGSVLTMTGLPSDVTLTAVGLEPQRPGVLLFRCASAEFVPTTLAGLPLPSVDLRSQAAYPATASAAVTEKEEEEAMHGD